MDDDFVIVEVKTEGTSPHEEERRVERAIEDNSSDKQAKDPVSPIPAIHTMMPKQTPEPVPEMKSVALAYSESAYQECCVGRLTACLETSITLCIQQKDVYKSV